MVKIFPFKGIIYNKKVIDNLSKVMAPPYDVLSPEQRDKLYELHPYNVVRLILGKEFSGDSEPNNKYLRAEKFFESWLKAGLLVSDEKPYIYVYEQRYSSERRKFTRRGFISLIRLEDFDGGKVLPHEETFAKPKLDRLELMRSCSANFDSVFSIFSDQKDYVDKILKKTARRKPLIKVRDGDGGINCLWRLDNRADIRKLMKFMSDKTVFIADGHHRYGAALKFRDEMKEKYQKFTGEELYNHVMMYFTPVEGKGLSIFPIHRLIHRINDLDGGIFKEALKEYFDLTEIPFSKRTEERSRKKLFSLMGRAGQGEHFFGMLIYGENKYYLLKLRDERAVDKFVKEDRPKEWRRLDVTVLHALAISHILGITTEKVDAEGHIKYVKDASEAAKAVLNGEFQVAFFLNPTKVSQIVEIASEKEKMPQKSTYFYPKLLTGLVMNKIYFDDKVAG